MVGLRFFTVYGPWGRPDMAVFEFATKIYEGDELTPYDYPLLARDFTYIDDIVDGVIAVMGRVRHLLFFSFSSLSRSFLCLYWLLFCFHEHILPAALYEVGSTTNYQAQYTIFLLLLFV